VSTPPEKIAEVRQWLIKAERDLLVADRAAHQPPPLLDVAVYHAQQAAEKALKAFLTWRDEPFRRVHDLGELTRQCAGLDPDFLTLQVTAALLTPYAVAFRYPGAVLEPSAPDAEAALLAAREAVSFVRARLPAAVQP
jgi:HEPN domain-containing protein